MRRALFLNRNHSPNVREPWGTRVTHRDQSNCALKCHESGQCSFFYDGKCIILRTFFLFFFSKCEVVTAEYYSRGVECLWGILAQLKTEYQESGRRFRQHDWVPAPKTAAVALLSFRKQVCVREYPLFFIYFTLCEHFIFLNWKRQWKVSDTTMSTELKPPWQSFSRQFTNHNFKTPSLVTNVASTQQQRISKMKKYL